MPRKLGAVTAAQVLELLKRYESPNVTFIASDGSWPIVWARARGVHVWDAAGRRYLDLTAAFGVAATGHANRRVVQAGQRQMGRLLHAMGDVHPHELKARLARELSRRTFERWTRAGKATGPDDKSRAAAICDWLTGKTIFCNSGFEAVEAALKTALLATGRRGIIAFEGAYHGLGYGALNATHRALFRAPFQSQLGQFGHFVPFPTQPTDLERLADRLDRLAARYRIGAVLVEPVQGRGGIRVPPSGFLPLLRRWCDTHRAVLILDEIYTGCGRTGRWFGCEHSGVVPDLICLGKALTGGFPLSACVGRADLVDAAWPKSSGEAIHTSTFLAHPVGCAMTLAQLAEIDRLGLVQRSARLGAWLLDRLQHSIRPAQLTCQVRGLGLMVGLELRHRSGTPATAEAQRVIKAMLRRGFILLAEGEHSNVISLTPPLIITQAQLQAAVTALGQCLQEL